MQSTFSSQPSPACLNAALFQPIRSSSNRLPEHCNEDQSEATSISSTTSFPSFWGLPVHEDSHCILVMVYRSFDAAQNLVKCRLRRLTLINPPMCSSSILRAPWEEKRNNWLGGMEVLCLPCIWNYNHFRLFRYHRNLSVSTGAMDFAVMMTHHQVLFAHNTFSSAINSETMPLKKFMWKTRKGCKNGFASDLLKYNITIPLQSFFF